MTKLNEICEFLEQVAPTHLAEEWDNVGLLAGDNAADVAQVMTCLTITPESAAEAISRNADLIVTHHPLPFRAIRKLTTDSTPTRLLWNLIRHGIAVYSPHTGFDSAATGINQMICDRLGLVETRPLVPDAENSVDLGAGRIGRVDTDMELASLIGLLKQKFSLAHLQYVGDLDQRVSVVASACGSGGSLLEPANRAGCDAFVTGEANFHTCLEAEAAGVSVLLLGHYHSERFAIEVLAQQLQRRFTEIVIWSSNQESDPLKWA